MIIGGVELTDWFDGGTIARGTDYAQNGHVASVTEVRPRELEAIVDGGGGRRYLTTITLPSKHDRHLRTSCDCPVGVACKHAVAALIAYREMGALRASAPRRPGVSAVTPTLDYALQRWLSEVKAADTTTERVGEGYSPTVRDRLIYVLFTHGSEVTADVFKAMTRKDGDFAPNPRRYDVDKLDRGHSPQFVLEIDRRVVRRLRRVRMLTGSAYHSYGYAPDDDREEPGAVLEAMRLVAETGRGRVDGVDGPTIALGPEREGRFTWREEGAGGARLTMVDAHDAPLRLLPGAPAAYLDPASGEIGPLALEAPLRMARALAMAPPAPPEALADVSVALSGLKAFRPPPAPKVAIEVRDDVAPTPVARLHQAQVHEHGDDDRHYWSPRHRPTFGVPALALAFDYDGAVVESDGDEVRRREGDRTVIIQRHHDAEDAAEAELAHYGLAPIEFTDLEAVQDDRDLFVLEDGWDEPRRAADFLADGVPALRAAGWRVEIEPSWPIRLHDGTPDIRAEIRESGDDWFALGVALAIDGQRVDLAPLLAQIVRLLPVKADGGFEEGFDLEEFLEDVVLRPQLPDGSFVSLQAIDLAPLAAAFITAERLFSRAHISDAAGLRDVAEALEGCGAPFVGGDALLALGDKLRALRDAPPADPPPQLRAELRPYQKKGLGWLRALADTGYGGVLADDMGLGKTVQTLALLAQRQLVERAEHPSLVIAPTSLVATWVGEAAKFTPDLRVLALHGPDRHADFDRIADHDVVVTTYPLLRRDHPVLTARPWDVVALDEAQAVKNPASQAAKLIRKLDARTRLALTGTPMENSLGDLWAQIDWLVPGLLGDRKAFRDGWLTPIEKNGDARRQAMLVARVRPFMLRRTKAEVATELPDKVEVVDRVVMGDRQRGLYETIRLTMDRRVRDAVAARGFAASRITILDALLKLRQVCCDPALLKEDDAARYPSAKRARLMEQLEELIAEGRRVLVFSQFVKMLRLIETDVQARGWDYGWLTGQTKDRAGAVRRFQEGHQQLFLISLKAGGVGLTLTTADTVVLFDPWWNPAVERQAMDRAHRIGQTKTVFVHRLVTERTVEDAIMAMQARKQGLADALFEGRGDAFDLGADDIAGLFGGGAAHTAN